MKCAAAIISQTIHSPLFSEKGAKKPFESIRTKEIQMIFETHIYRQSEPPQYLSLKS
jgi:hypothetical protein